MNRPQMINQEKNKVFTSGLIIFFQMENTFPSLIINY